MKDYKFLTQPLIRIDDIKREIPNESSMFSTIKRLQGSKRIKKLKSGLYALIDPTTGDIFANKYEIATAIYDGAYIAYHSALEYYGLANQSFLSVWVASEKCYSPVVIDGRDYVFFNTNYRDGIVEIEHNSLIRVTELERTVVDCLDRIDVGGGLEEVVNALSLITYCDEDKLLYHLNSYNKKFLYKKAGYILSFIHPKYLSNKFFDVCKTKMSSRCDDLRENNGQNSHYDREWKLIVPDYIINTEF